MSFHFYNDFKKLKVACPPVSYTALDILPVYRWVFDPITDPRNFQPQFYRNPKKYFTTDDNTKCSGLAISLFINSQKAEDTFYGLLNSVCPKAYIHLGTHIAEGNIMKTDGVNQIPPDSNGHFNHHPYICYVLSYQQKFTIIKKL